MNDYRISYTIGGNGIDIATITERNEAAARRAFKTFFKDGTITSIELFRENTCASKKQERDTLAAIKKMVAELGPQSYLATAFEGCFEDAEQNIEYDWGCSQKRLADAAAEKVTELEAKVKELKEQLAESQKDWEAAHAAAHAIAEQKDAEIAALREHALSPDDLTDAIQLIVEKRIDLDAEVKNAAERIVEAAAEPESAAFKNAVTDHRAAKSNLDYYTALLERLIKAKGE